MVHGHCSLRLKLTASSTAYWFWCCGRWTGGGARSITTCCLLLQEGERVLLFGIYMTNSSLFSSTENLNTASSHTPWAQLSWVLWACVPRRVSAAYPDALRACPTMALGAEAPMPVPSLIQGSEVPHTKSALTSFSVACWANADEDVATAWLVTPAFPVRVVITAKADMVPCLYALHLLLVQLLLAGVATTQAVFLASACAIGRSINNRACVVVN